MSVLKLTVYKDDIKDGFMRFAGRTDIADEVDICLKRPKGYKCFTGIEICCCSMHLCHYAYSWSVA